MSRPLLKGCSTRCNGVTWRRACYTGSERYAQDASYHRGVTERAISFVQEEPMPVNTGLMS